LRCRRPLALGHGQRIAGQREVVHADVLVAVREEARDRAAQHRQALSGCRQVGGSDAPLRLEALRQVGVRVQRDAVRAQRGDLRHGAREAFRGLARQPVDQVGVDRLEAEGACAGHELAHAVVRLHAMHRLLHLRVEVLHAEADAVEADVAQVREALRRHGARVDLDRHLGAVGDAKRAAQRRHHSRQLGVGQEGRRAAAEVQLRHARRRAERVVHEVDLGVERVQVSGGALVVLRDHLVAGAVVAQRLAERDVHVHRQRRCRTGRALREGARDVGRAVGLDEAVGGRIRGVARPWRVEASQQRL
jgi:hypothetical protein